MCPVDFSLVELSQVTFKLNWLAVGSSLTSVKGSFVHGSYWQDVLPSQNCGASTA